MYKMPARHKTIILQYAVLQRSEAGKRSAVTEGKTAQAEGCGKESVMEGAHVDQSVNSSVIFKDF